MERAVLNYRKIKLLRLATMTVTLATLIACNANTDIACHDIKESKMEQKATNVSEDKLISEQCPITDEDIMILAKVITAEAQVVYWDGTKYGVSYLARQAAVGWCALNRYDMGYGTSLTEILTAPNQFAYHAGTEATEETIWLANDIVQRWWAEKQGEDDVGRTLPSDYLYFHGDGRENHFRNKFSGGDIWDWSLPDPYKED